MTTPSGPRIRHIVAFSLRHEAGSSEADSFVSALRSLGSIDGVDELEVVRQVGAKNTYELGVVMEFADRAAYDAYNAHPDHVAFVEDRWIPEVTEFMEIDFVALSEVGPAESRDVMRPER